MDAKTGIVLIGAAGLAAYLLTREQGSKTVAAPAPDTKRPVAGYGQALYDESSGQWQWLPSPEPYVVNPEGYPVPAASGQTPAGWGIPVVNPFGQIPGAPDLQTGIAPNTDWYEYDPAAGAYRTTFRGYLGVHESMTRLGRGVPRESRFGAEWWSFPSSGGFTFSEMYASASGKIVGLYREDVDVLARGVLGGANVFTLPHANWSGFAQNFSNQDLVIVELPATAV